MSLTIDQMRLNPTAKAGAVILKERCPYVVFTSGRRDRHAQARIMAENSIGERQWVSHTYLHAADFQTWLDLHPEAQTVEQIAHGFSHILAAMPDDDLEKLSRHCSGNAFDVLPLIRDAKGTPTEEGQMVLLVIRQLPGLDKLLTKEGGKVRWHAQFTESAEV